MWTDCLWQNPNNVTILTTWWKFRERQDWCINKAYCKNVKKKKNIPLCTAHSYSLKIDKGIISNRTLSSIAREETVSCLPYVHREGAFPHNRRLGCLCVRFISDDYLITDYSLTLIASTSSIIFLEAIWHSYSL